MIFLHFHVGKLFLESPCLNVFKLQCLTKTEQSITNAKTNVHLP